MGIGTERASPPSRDGSRIDEPTRDLLRAVNEKVRVFAAQIGDAADVDFVCECPNRECFRVVRLTQAEFESISAAPGRYVVCRDHVGDGERVVEEARHYTVVERVGES